jgi:putative methyltransferase (TIGR04325 family)
LSDVGAMLVGAMIPGKSMIPDVIKRPLRPFIQHLRAIRAKPRAVQAYPSYEAALAECESGYCDKELAEITVGMVRGVVSGRVASVLFRPNVSATLKALRISGANSVIDFGGGCGLHYFLARQELHRQFKWAVIETQVMVRASASLQSDELHFFSHVAEANSWLNEVPDLVFTSGAIAYTPEPETSLSRLVEVRAPYLAVLREALAFGPRRIIVQISRLRQNAPGKLPAGAEDREVKYPRTFMSRDDFAKIVESSYQFVFRGSLQHEFPLLADGVVLRQGYNFICKRK